MFFDEDGQDPQPPMTKQLELMRKIWALDHAMRHLSRTMESTLGLTGPQRLVVRVVGQRPGIGAGDLAELLHIEASTLTAHLTRLEEAGLLERQASPTDARRTLVQLTPKGRRLDVATPGTVEAAIDHTLTGFSADHVVVVERFLTELVVELEAQAAACEVPRRRRRAG